VFARWRADLEAGTPPALYPVADPGSPLARIEIGPGQVTLLGGPPAVGKTAFCMQLLTDALRLTPDLRLLVANVEMSPIALLDRQLARLSGIDLGTIRHRRLSPDHVERFEWGMEELEALAPRLAFLRPPWTMQNLAEAGDAFEAGLIVLDYVQRFTASGEQAQRKAAIDAVMDSARRIADCGAAVVVVAAVGRQRNDRGQSGYSGLNLASFRETSELEYGADDAYLLVRDKPEDPMATTLVHAKSRNGEPRNLELRFNGVVQRFDPVEEEEGASEGGEW
jgi:replicative DNA helicase